MEEEFTAEGRGVSQSDESEVRLRCQFPSCEALCQRELNCPEGDPRKEFFTRKPNSVCSLNLYPFYSSAILCGPCGESSSLLQFG